DLADRLRPVVVQPERLAVAHDRRHRQERLDLVAYDDRAATGSASTVWLREGLVQVDVDDVETHVAGPRDSAHRVQVRAVVVEERARVVEDLLYVLDVLVEETQRRRVREHQPGRPLVHELPEMRNV